MWFPYTRSTNEEAPVALFKKSEPVDETPAPAPTQVPGGKKSAPTPTRREAEAARRARLNPQLTKREAKERERQQENAARAKALATVDALPERTLMRNVVDSRFNMAEYALPILLGIMALTLIPGAQEFITWFMAASWGYILAMAVDAWLMWNKFKKLMAERMPNKSTKGLFLYGFNRQTTFRRWRNPKPAVNRGEEI